MTESEAKVAEFMAMIENADADELVGMLATVRLESSNERLRKSLTKTLALRLAARVMQPGYLDDGRPF